MPENKLISLSKRLRKLREEADLSQEELAKRAGISVKYLQNLEGKKPKNPSLLTLEKIAKGLDVSIDALVSDK